MIRNNQSIYFIILSLLSVCLFCSCITETGYSDDGDAENNNETYIDVVPLTLNVRPINMSGSSIGNENEQITSLRIIMLSDGIIEANRYITFAPESAFEFTYSTVFWTTEGQKEFYIIANENSVGHVNYITTDAQNETSLPTDLPDDFHELLSRYEAKADATLGEDFVNVMNAVYFEPHYESYDKKNYLLPYISYYKSIEVKGKVTPNGKLYPKYDPIEMLLVPAVAKFIFRFENYRSYPVEITDITVSQINDYNYVLPHVGENELTKKYGEKEYYWIDWLEKVAKDSQSEMNSGFENNSNFNENTGWIFDYEMPKEDKSPLHFIDEEKEIPDSSEKDDLGDPLPFKKQIGPFYCPEARNIVKVKKEVTEGDKIEEREYEIQAYYLTLGLRDTKPSSNAPTFENVYIGNLGALFRNTCVIINVVMREGSVEAYAEIAPWTKKSINGWVDEEHESNKRPSFPF